MSTRRSFSSGRALSSRQPRSERLRISPVHSRPSRCAARGDRVFDPRNVAGRRLEGALDQRVEVAEPRPPADAAHRPRVGRDRPARAREEHQRKRRALDRQRVELPVVHDAQERPQQVALAAALPLGGRGRHEVVAEPHERALRPGREGTPRCVDRDGAARARDLHRGPYRRAAGEG
jgi:hypothetical protein